MLITHNHNDHIGGGVAIINSGINVSQIYIKTYLCNDGSSCDASQKKRYNNFIDAAKQALIPITYIETLKDGYTFNMNSISISLYNTEQRMDDSAYIHTNENYNSVLEYIVINNVKTLLTSDTYNSKILSPIANIVGKVDVLKVPHHAYSSCGVNSSNVKVLNPKYLIITNSITRLGGSYVKCIKNFSSSLPRYFTNDMNNSVIVDYSNNKVEIIEN